MKKIFLPWMILISTLGFSQYRYSQEKKSYENGKLKEIKVKQQGIEKTIKFYYNADGQRISSEIFDNFGDRIFDAKKSYKDSKDLKQTWYNAIGKIKDKLLYKYDNQNRLNQIYNYFGNTDDYFYTKYQYEGKKIVGSKSYYMVKGKKYDLSQINKAINNL